VFTFDEAKLLLAYEKGVRGVRILTIHGEEIRDPRSKQTMHSLHLLWSVEILLARRWRRTSYAARTQMLQMTLTFLNRIGTSTGKQQDAQWIRGTAKRSFDGLTSIDARDATTVGDENTSNARFSRLVAHVEATCAWTDSSSSS
tara:strand:- start:6604 stop:7035 length:432 start_codon:yes stop_codon:yes gene_type:complete